MSRWHGSALHRTLALVAAFILAGSPLAAALAQATQENGGSADQAVLGAELHEAAIGYYMSGDYGAAHDAFANAAAIRRKIPGGEVELIKTLSALGNTRRLLGDFTAALESLNEAIQLAEDTDGIEVAIGVGPRINRLIVYFVQQKLELIDQEAEQVIDLLNAAGMQESQEAATMWFILGGAHNRRANYAAARPALEKSLELHALIYGPESSQAAGSTHNLGVMYLEAGDLETAAEILKKALELKVSAQGEQHPSTASTLSSLGNLFRDIGDLDQSLEYLLRSARITGATQGEDSAAYASTLSNIGITHRRRGEFLLAIEAFERALEIQREKLRPNHPLTANSLNNLGNVYYDLGDIDRAFRMYSESLAIREAELGPDHPEVATSLNNLSNVYGDNGDDERARELVARALAIRLAHYGELHPDVGSSYHNLGMDYLAEGDIDAARDALEDALRVRTEVMGWDHFQTGFTQLMLADLDAIDGDLDSRRKRLAGAEKIAVVNPGARPFEARLYHNLAGAYADESNTELAIFYGKRAVNVVQAMRASLSSLDPGIQRSFGESKRRIYQDLADWLITAGRLDEAQQVLKMLREEELFDFVQRRSSDDNALNTRAAFTAVERPWVARYDEISGKVAALGEELAKLRSRQMTAARLGEELSANELERLDRLAGDQRVALAEFHRVIDEMHDYFAQLGGSRAVEFGRKDLDSLSATQSVLRRMHRQTNENVTLLTYLVTDERLRILVTTSNAQLHRDAAIRAAELNRLVFDMREALQSPAADYRHAAQALYDVMIAPVASDLEQADTHSLLVSLDEALRYVPVAALHDGDAFVAENFAVSVFTPAARFNLERPPAADWRVAGLGVTRSVDEYRALPAVRTELDQIIRETASKDMRQLDEIGILSGRIWLDEAFTAEALGAAIDVGYPVVHVATHFVFKPGTERDSFLLLGDGNRLTLEEFIDRGFVFESVDLLTLSACDTAVGGGNGREIEGFGALAQNKGASAVMATLWPVADASTAEFMTRFYRYRQNGGLAKGAALRAVQNDFIAGAPDLVESVAAVRGLVADADSEKRATEAFDLSHPFYWAPFILMGNWQ